MPRPIRCPAHHSAARGPWWIGLQLPYFFPQTSSEAGAEHRFVFPETNAGAELLLPLGGSSPESKQTAEFESPPFCVRQTGRRAPGGFAPRLPHENLLVRKTHPEAVDRCAMAQSRTIIPQAALFFRSHRFGLVAAPPGSEAGGSDLRFHPARERIAAYGPMGPSVNPSRPRRSAGGIPGGGNFHRRGKSRRVSFAFAPLDEYASPRRSRGPLKQPVSSIRSPPLARRASGPTLREPRAGLGPGRRPSPSSRLRPRETGATSNLSVRPGLLLAGWRGPLPTIITPVGRILPPTVHVFGDALHTTSTPPRSPTLADVPLNKASPQAPTLTEADEHFRRRRAT